MALSGYWVLSGYWCFYLNNGQIDAVFRNSIETKLVDFFKRGLKLEIEQRPPTGEYDNNDVNDIVKNAIAIDRKLASKRDLRIIDQPKFDRNQFTIEGHFLVQYAVKMHTIRAITRLA